MYTPKYSSIEILTSWKDKSKDDILYSYSITKCKFSFPDSVKYPSIGCFIDETTTVYPLKGEALLTGPEYLLAQSQGCKFEISEIIYIPFDDKKPQPFYTSIKELQRLRNDHPKGSVLNALYKEMGNSQYGLTARGISSKKRLDLKTGQNINTPVNDLANPLICT